MAAFLSIIWVLFIMVGGAWVAAENLGELNLVNPAHWAVGMGVAALAVVPVIIGLQS